MTTQARNATVSLLLAVILFAICAVAIVPQTAFAQNEEKPAYTGVEIPANVDLHDATRIALANEQIPTITVFTHGMSSNFGYWGADYNEIDGEKVVTNLTSDSLPMQFKEKYDANIYVVHSLNTYAENSRVKSNLYCTVNGVDYYTHSETSAGIAAQTVDNDGKLAKYLTGAETIDFSKHTIIVFNEHGDKNIELSFRYKELHDIIDRMSYEYKAAYGVIPRINLVGHSRGGLLNAMYANEHPYNVDTVYSLGTPYSGSLPSLLLEKAEPFLSEDMKNVYNNSIMSPVDIYDINNKNEEIKNTWNNNGTASSVKLKTLSSSFDFDFLIALLTMDKTYALLQGVTLEQFKEILSTIIKVLDAAATISVVTGIQDILAAATFSPFSIIFAFAAVVKFASVEPFKEFKSILKEVRETATEPKQCYDGFVRAMYSVRDDGVTLLNTFCNVIFGDNTIANEILGDMLVQVSSQQASKYAGATNLYHENYTASLCESDGKLSYQGNTSDDDEFKKISDVNNPAVPHNLECRNPRMIAAILDDIRVAQPCSHQKLPCVSISSLYHNYVCDVCGYVNQVRHSIYTTYKGGTGHYKICRECNYKSELESHKMSYNSFRGICTLCGYVGPIEQYLKVENER